MAPTRQRPPLDLGPMTGDEEYIRERSEHLVKTYAGLLDVDEIKLVDCSPEGGRTDCFSTIWAGLKRPEGYLVVEHELSHWLFETDPVMAQQFVKKLSAKLITRAGLIPGMATGAQASLQYENQLSLVIHALWNVLEDWRCLWLWSQLYRGGGELQLQWWHDMAEYEYVEARVLKDLVCYLTCRVVGVDYPAASFDFQDCVPAIIRARNLVEGVDNVACLAITARLIDEIGDALLENNPPPPPSQQQQQGGKPNPAQQQKEEKKREALQRLKLLCNALPRDGSQKGQNLPGIGRPDTVQPPEKEILRRGSKEGKLGRIDQLVNADDSQGDDSGTTPFQLIMQQGADAMAQRLDDARRAMLLRQDTPDEANAAIHLGWSQEAGIPLVHVVPSRPLPLPTATGYENRRILEQLRMVKRRKKDYDGDFNADRFILALGNGELDHPFFDKMTRVAKFELLLLFDLSGSMLSGRALELTERAIADAAFAVTAIRSKVFMWGFSDQLYIYDQVGSPLSTTGVKHGSTCTVQALDVAHKWGRRHPTRRAVMLVTDGWPTSCRATRSTGNPLKDLNAVLGEMRDDKLPLSVLGIRHLSETVEATVKQYDTAFGVGGYGMVSSFDEMARELPKAVRILASAHVQKGLRRA